VIGLLLNPIQIDGFRWEARAQQSLFNFGTDESRVLKIKAPRWENDRLLLGKTTVLDVDTV